MNTLFKNKTNGFSLIELVISVAVLSAISLGVAYNIANVFKQQSMVNNMGEAKSFANDLMEYLSSPEYCENELIGQPFNTSMNKDLSVTGMGDVKSASRGGSIAKNSQLSESIILKELTIANKTGVPAEQVFYQNQNVNLRAIRVTVNMAHRVSEGSGSSNWTDLKPKYVDIPVLTVGGNIIGCGMNAGLDPQLTCTQIGSTWNASKDSCEPKEQCNLRGTYTRWVCTPADGGCGGNVTTLVGGTAGGSGGKGGSTVGGIPNPVTGALSCPPLATPELSGVREATYTVSCGKKCTRNIREVTSFFICMECG